jgi:hypothetical protein
VTTPHVEATIHTEQPSAADRAQTSRNVARLLTLAIAGIGGLTFVLLLCNLGTSEVWRGLAALSAFGPALALLELGRTACELLGTRALLKTTDAQLPMLRFVRGQLLAQTLDVVMPAGRTAAEAAKATLYAPHLGLPQAAAIGAALQLACLAANALWALAGYVASADVGLPQPLRVGLLGFTAATGGVVILVCVLASVPRARALLGRVRFLQATLERFALLLRQSPKALGQAVLAQLLGRAVQAVQLALLSYGLGAAPSFASSAILQAVYMVGAACGELIPAQLGATDAAFVLAAPALGLTPSAAFSASLALHAVQLLMGVVTFIASAGLWWLEGRVAQSAARPVALATSSKTG